jgi:large subunit ribosomal protein L26e
MKPDSERTVRYKSPLSKKRDFLHVHVSKELAKRLAQKKRALLVRKGDEVKIMRGSSRGKTGKVIDVNHLSSKVYVEGVTRRTAKGKESPAALEPSNLMLINIESTKEREGLFKAGEKKEAKAVEQPAQKKEQRVVAEESVVVGGNKPAQHEIK